MPETIELLAKLVAFKTVSRDPNEALIAYIADYFHQRGGRVRVLPGILPGKANLLASFGPEGADGLILSGHSDVVPIDGQAWSQDAFTLTEREGNLYGRGAVDMKGFIASTMKLVASMPRLQKPLHIAISHDEEIGCVGVRSMLAKLAAEGFKASGCVVGEPTGLKVAIGHKGKVAGCICCRGEAAHSANPDLGCNAIYLAADMILELQNLQLWLRANGAYDAAYAVPYSSVHVGTIHGGTVLNIVPNACDVTYEFRLLPGDDVAALLARLRDAGARLTDAQKARGRFAAVEITEDNGYPGLDTSADLPFTTLVQEAAGQRGLTKLGFGSEAGLFDRMIGLPAVVCGPGSIDRAHKPDEFITRNELDECDVFLSRLLATLT